LVGLVPGVTDGGTLVTIDFSALQAGTGTVALSQVILLDSSLVEIAASLEHGSVMVDGVVVPEPGYLPFLALSILVAARRARRGRRL
jgi:hypothetical protein